MAFVVEQSAEPIPGYRLIERLGRGGFGEVWKAQAPGGLFKAVKIVHGDVGCVDADGSHRAEQELQALRRVQSIRHPYLLSIERYDIVDGRLIIVTELADGNLYDRYEEFSRDGQAGIPRAVLLRYLREAAEALDMMNGQHSLQHLDIKPQNLFLIQDHIKVADFGLVKDLESVRSEACAAATPHYAAPETFDEKISRFCDQYSLAIVYQELLTGHRPFSGSTIQQLAMQHLQAPPNLSSLPHADRPAIAKALAKKPENRHSSCLALIDALTASSVEPQRKIAARVEDAPKATDRGVRNLNESIRRLEKKGAKPFRPETPATAVRIRKEDFAPVVVDEPDRRTAPPEIVGTGTLFPALIVGLGRSGLHTLQQLRQALGERFGGMTALPHLKLLYIDSDPQAADAAIQAHGAAALTTDEVLLARLNRAGHYLKPRRNGSSLIEGWFDPQWLYRIPREPSVHGQRALGRLAFGDWYQSITERFVDLLEDATEPDALLRADKNTALGIRTNRPRVYVIAHLGGGTGGGAFIDVAYALRHRLKALGYDEPDVVGIIRLPKATGDAPAQIAASGNAYAALIELAHFSRPDTTYQCSFDDRDVAWKDAQPPFTRLAMLPDETDHPPTHPEPAANYLLRELTQPFGRVVDAARKSSLASVSPTQEVCTGVFGVASLAWPREALVRAASRQVVELIIQRWARRDVGPIRPAIHAWVNQQLSQESIGPEAILERLQSAAQSVVGQCSDTFFGELAQRLEPKGWFGGGFNTDAAEDVMFRWRELLGRPDVHSTDSQAGLMAEALAAAAVTLSKDWGNRLARLAVTLIEQPEYRLTGAEEAISRFRHLLDEAQANYATAAERLASTSATSYDRALQIVAAPHGRRSAQEFYELAKVYPNDHLQYQMQLQAAQVCHELSHDLGEQLGEIRFCRQRLDELAERIRTDVDAVPESAHYLLPPGCTNAADAVAQVIQGITDADFAELDRRMQKMLQSQFTALVHVCMSTSDMFANLEPAMVKLATQYVAGRIGDANVAALFFERYPSDAAAADAIVRAFDDAAPTLGDQCGQALREVMTVSVPPGCEGDRLAKLAQDAIGNHHLEAIHSGEDISFYRELPRVPLARLQQLGPAARECYEHVASHDRAPPHTRNDVEQWLTGH